MNKTLYYYAAGHLDNLYSGVDGGSLIRLPFFEELCKDNWKIKWLGYEYKTRKSNHIIDILALDENDYAYSLRDIVLDIGYNYTETDIEEDGILFVELRPNISKPGYNFENEFNTQIALIKSFIKKNRLVFVHDQDGWYSDIPIELRSNIVLLAAFENIDMVIAAGFHEVYKFIWAWKDMSDKFNLNLKKQFDTTYCGNVYNRRDDFLKFFKPLHDANKKIVVAGNWLRKTYDDRDFSLDNFPNNIWLGSTEHWTTLPLINMSNFVVHISNPHQQELGIICIRVFEALMGRVPLFVNKNIFGIEKYVDEIQLVSDGNELLEKINTLDLNDIFKKFELKMQKYHISNHIQQFNDIVMKETYVL